MNGDELTPAEERVEKLIGQMTLEEKANLCIGCDMFSIRPVERLGLPKIHSGNGPQGARRGANLDHSSMHLPNDLTRSSIMPAAVAMGATWNPELIKQAGSAIGRDCLNLGIRVLLGPTVCIIRNPFGGRNFETFSEDPHLSAAMVVPYICGVQEQGVVATVKHFAANNQEFERINIHQHVEERALREIYLPGFEAAVKEAKVWSIMTAYHALNGQPCSENEFLLKRVLKGEWEFPGFVMTDWWATNHADPVTMVKSGLDLEMPNGIKWKDKENGEDALLVQLVKAGKIEDSELDDKVRRITRALISVGAYDSSEPPPYDQQAQRKACLATAREAITLLKNEGNLLPLSCEATKKIAVIGPLADMIGAGGGSSTVCSDTYTTPLTGIRELVGEKVEVTYAQGSLRHDVINQSLDPKWLRLPGSNEQGAKVSYFDCHDMSSVPVECRVEQQFGLGMSHTLKLPQFGANYGSVRYESILIAPSTGRFKLVAHCVGGELEFSFGDKGRLSITSLENSDDTIKGVGQVGDDLKGARKVTKEISITLEAGQELPIILEYRYHGGKLHASVSLQPDADADALLAEAAETAAAADAVVLCVGLFHRMESEGHDLKTLTLPEGQLALIEKVTSVNPKTIVTLFTGTALMIEDVVASAPAVLLPFYPGQEGGQAIAEILFGEVNPSGRLQFSIFKRWEDCPASANYRTTGENLLDVTYTEGIFVGYRHLEKHNISPLFPFGHGLSYTTFSYTNMTVAKADQNTFIVDVEVKNTGDCSGSEVVQLYIEDVEASAERPLKELKGFKKIELSAGEVRKVSFRLNPRDFSFWDPTSESWTVEPGLFKIHLGSSSADIRLTADLCL